MMVRMISTHEARANFGDLLGSVYYTGEPVVVARKGKPMAVLVSPTDFERLQSLDPGRTGGPDMTLRVDFSSGRKAQQLDEAGDGASDGGSVRGQYTPVGTD